MGFLWSLYHWRFGVQMVSWWDFTISWVREIYNNNSFGRIKLWRILRLYGDLSRGWYIFLIGVLAFLSMTLLGKCVLLFFSLLWTEYHVLRSRVHDDGAVSIPATKSSRILLSICVSGYHVLCKYRLCGYDHHPSGDPSTADEETSGTGIHFPIQ